MTRKFLDTVKADALALLPDNTIGSISPLDVRTVLNDMLDSTQPLIGVMYGPAIAEAVATTATYAAMVGTLFTTSEGGDATFVKINTATGTIQTNTTAGFSYQVYGEVNFEAGNGVDFEFTILLDGVPVANLDVETGRGAGNFTSATINWNLLHAPADTDIQLAVRSPSGASTLTVSNIFMQVIQVATTAAT